MFPDWEWTELNLPPRHFSWRIRGNPLIWSQDCREQLEREYDLLVATSMVDLATLRGLVPALCKLPTALYFHENQFLYPEGSRRHSLLEAQMVSLYASLAADCVLFNSAHNRDSFFTGLRGLLQRLPDLVPAGVDRQLDEKSAVLPVPLLAEDTVAVDPFWPGLPGDYPQRPLRLLWSARFEHDKGGEGLLQLLDLLVDDGLFFEIAVTGQQFRNSPPVFATIARRFAPQLVQFGFVESPHTYRALQAGADIVLSTARHEFQGLAILQSVAAGCVPVVPDRLAYRDIYPAELRYTSATSQPEREARAAADLVERLALRIAKDDRPVPAVNAFSLDTLAPRYRELLVALAERGG
jgi:glycosyltransferase involved in cell wall biosynthesis